MIKRNQQGGVGTVFLNLILILALIAVGAFAYWAFQQRQDYKNNFDLKLKDAVAQANTAQKAQLEKQFAETAKSPYKTYRGPVAYGVITFNYPKTWSAYVDESGGSQPINGYFFPGIVPAINQSGNTPTAFALRAELVSSDYSDVVKQMDGQVQQGKLTAIAYVPPKMKGVPNVQTGTKFDGQISQNLSGSMVVIKVRDKTLKIYTLSQQYLSDFNNVVLKSLTFVP